MPIQRSSEAVKKLISEPPFMAFLIFSKYQALRDCVSCCFTLFEHLIPPTKTGKTFGFRFAPRIRDLNDKRLYINGEADDYPALASMISKKVNKKLIQTHWDEIFKQGTAAASLVLRKTWQLPTQKWFSASITSA